MQFHVHSCKVSLGLGSNCIHIQFKVRIYSHLNPNNFRLILGPCLHDLVK